MKILSNLSADQLIQFLLDKKLAKTRFDSFLNEQMLEITPLGIDIITILIKLKSDSIESEKSNIEAAEKLDQEERNL